MPRFRCPHCEAEYPYKPQYEGKSGPCPICKKPVTLTDIERAATTTANDAPPAIPDDTRQCPSCAQTIAREAKRCPYCREQLADEPEVVLWTGRPSWAAYLGLLFWGALLSVFFVGLFFIFYAILDRSMKQYTVTTKRLMYQSGILTQRRGQVYVADIRSIDTIRTFNDLVCGTTTVLVGTSGQAGYEITFQSISNDGSAQRALETIQAEIRQ